MVGHGGASLARSIVILGIVLIAVAGCSSSSPPQGTYKLGQPYQIQGRWYYPEYDPDYDRTGIASWYGEPFHGRATANGEIFDRGVMTAAHPTLPLPSLVRVTNLENQREMMIRVNDRGPFIGDRIIDLSQQAARELGFEEQGIAPVRVQFVGLSEARGTPPRPTIRRAAAPSADPGGPAPPAARPPAPRVPAASLAQEAAQCQGPFIQVGAFAEPARAQRVVAELHALQAMPVSLATPGQDRLARVRLGPIPDPAAAIAALDRLKQFGFAEAFIVTPAAAPSTPC
jgi:rare lipoprotein A